jgi:hypothetical protein
MSIWCQSVLTSTTERYSRRNSRLLPAGLRCGRVQAPNGASATPSTADSATTPPRQDDSTQWAREGNRGTTLKPARPAHTPNTGSSVKPLPDPPPPYDRQPTVLAPQRRTHHRPLSERPLDKQRGLVRNHVDDPTAGRLLAIASGTSTSPHSESAPANDEPLTVWLGRCGIPVRLRDRP